ncbi:hypothetical protein [Lacipirellula parvula]|uniref:hypothetical protein n=1 Tax=Lacipirellula parvula TaxID=2650471 RepID=UPI00126087BC|nr:hypothetical protein [Lacipirellula parvula]
MSKRKTKPRRQNSARDLEHRVSDTRNAEVATVAWTVSVTTVFLCDIAAVAAHLYARANPRLGGAQMLSQLLLFCAAAIGLISLLLLPVVLRFRKTPPPGGFLTFAICSALAPILAVLVMALQR